jgi:hypothetical protein
VKKLLVLFLILSFEVSANECAQDTKKFCSGVEPGKGQLAKCLSDYTDQLAPACAKELKNFKTETVKKNPCFEELSEYCADLPSDPRNYEYCLLKHESRLGQKCSEDFKKKKGNIIVKNVCAQDIANTCYKELSEPEGAVTRCLIRNKAKLAGFCQKNLDKRIAEMKKKNPCFDDTEKHCPTQVKFVDIQDCLSKKVTSLAPACKTVVVAEQDKMKGNPCYRDLITHCRPGLSPKDQSDCLALNEEHISNACKQYRVNESNKVKKMVDLCEADRLKLCKDAPFKDGAIAKCLRKNKAQVSKECQSLL